MRERMSPSFRPQGECASYCKKEVWRGFLPAVEMTATINVHVPPARHAYTRASTSHSHRQHRWVEGMLSRSSGECTPRMAGPMDTMSR